MLVELDSTILHQKVGAFRVVPYFARQKIELPADIHDLIDVLKEALKRIEESEDIDERLPDKDFSFDDVWLSMESPSIDDLDRGCQGTPSLSYSHYETRRSQLRSHSDLHPNSLHPSTQTSLL